MRKCAFILLTVVSPLLVGCTRPVASFPFDIGGKSIALVAQRHPHEGKQGGLYRVAARRGSPPEQTTGKFTLKRAQSPPATEGDFYLLYGSASGPLELHLFERTGTSKLVTGQTVSLPDTAPPDGTHKTAAPLMRYLVPLKRGTKLIAFEVTSASPDAAIAIHGAGFARDYSGVEFGSNETSLREGVTVSSPLHQNGHSVTIQFPDLVKGLGGEQAQEILTYGYESGSGEVSVTATDSSGHTRQYRINLHKGIRKLYFYTATCEFTPSTVRISSHNRGFAVDSLLVRRFPTPRLPSSQPGSTAAIPADLGAMLAYAPRWWRQKDYEIFSWNLIPSVIVLEFRSYGVQASYMKRLAYFVEKRGYAGRLWTNAQLSHLVGWNAHDYRPKDLARFYSLAARKRFTLDSQEQHLKAILLANGILVRTSAGSYGPGDGAILTFAHSGSYPLRKLLLTHESFHGIFFTHPAYRKAVIALWKHSNQLERSLFRNVFLSYEGYNIADPYLVENEFQAYLMEQPVSQVEPYFDVTLGRRLQQMKIPSSSPLVRYFKDHPEIFRSSAERVQKAAEEAVGVRAGESVSLVPE